MEKPQHHEPYEINASPSENDTLRSALTILESGFDKLFESDNFQEYLKVMARFHNYSPNNVMMIMTQMPEATKVASFQTWKTLDRQVKRGEKAMKVWVPIHKKGMMLDKEGNEIETKELHGFRLGNVFDISQTIGKPLPEQPRPKEIETSSEKGTRLFEQLTSLNTQDGVSIEREYFPDPNLKGYYEPGRKKIVVSSWLAPDMAAKTLCHETGHVLSKKEGWALSYEDGEMIAEGAAFVVLHEQGIDTADYSFPYLVSWSHQDRNILKKNLGYIHKTAQKITRFIEKDEKKEPMVK